MTTTPDLLLASFCVGLPLAVALTPKARYDVQSSLDRALSRPLRPLDIRPSAAQRERQEALELIAAFRRRYPYLAHITVRSKPPYDWAREENP